VAIGLAEKIRPSTDTTGHLTSSRTSLCFTIRQISVCHYDRILANNVSPHLQRDLCIYVYPKTLYEIIKQRAGCDYFRDTVYPRELQYCTMAFVAAISSVTLCHTVSWVSVRDTRSYVLQQTVKLKLAWCSKRLDVVTRHQHSDGWSHHASI
jgi:hypothetical protein